MSKFESETIAAIATAVGGGIGIIRISGENAPDIIKSIFTPKRTNFESHKLYYGKITDSNGVIDETLITIMYGPKSYTGENVAEIHCHGGIESLRQILDLVIKKGARLAEPGEFTKRSFLNGRIDLSQAEAVADIIYAKTALGHRAAVKQLGGELADKVREYKSMILGCLARIEVAIDYPEHEIGAETNTDIAGTLTVILDKLNELIAMSETGRLIREGIETVIVGKPNVGKSSLLNALMRENRAIVTDIPGTTRDTLTEYLTLNGILLKITDTAGIRQTDDVIETIGIERSLEYIDRAELVLAVIDRVQGIDERDMAIFEKVSGKNVIILVNKADLEYDTDCKQLVDVINSGIIDISAKESMGLDELADMIKTMFFAGKFDTENQDIIINARHKQAVREAINHIALARDTATSGLPTDLVSIDLQTAYDYLGDITGDNMSEDLIDRIFADFCLGK